MVDDFLGLAAEPNGAATPKAVIAPHAAYLYSGPVAAFAFKSLSTNRLVRKVILLGPSHHCRFPGLALPQANAFRTPLGQLPVDPGLFEQVRSLPQVRVFDRAFEPEHCLEVELPFLQRTVGEFSILPMLTGEMEDEELADALEVLWGGPETVLVVSSDLSHFLDYDRAREIDAQTATAIRDLQPERISSWQACGSLAIRGLLLASRRRGLQARTIDLRNSGDSGGPRNRVVGYGAFSFSGAQRMVPV